MTLLIIFLVLVALGFILTVVMVRQGVANQKKETEMWNKYWEWYATLNTLQQGLEDKRRQQDSDDWLSQF